MSNRPLFVAGMVVLVSVLGTATFLSVTATDGREAFFISDNSSVNLGDPFTVHLSHPVSL